MKLQRMKPTLIKPVLCSLLLILLSVNSAIAEKEPDNTGQSFTLSFDQVMNDVAEPRYKFPKYTTQLINLANQNSQATRAYNVGQMSDLIQEFPGRSYDEWVDWYGKKYPNAVEQATDKTWEMIVKMRQAMNGIDREMVNSWISELILAKTYAGLRFQESILKTISEMTDTPYRLARPEEESMGIDGFLGSTPVSIKPVSYQSKKFLPETINVDIIYYEKVRGGIRVWHDF